MRYEFPEPTIPPFDLPIVALETEYTAIEVDGEVVMHTRNVYYGEWYVDSGEHSELQAGVDTDN